MTRKNIFSLVAVAVLGSGLAACGGGSVSTGAAGGSGGSGGYSSSIVVQTSHSASAAQQQNRLAMVISDMLVRKALSAAFTGTIYVYDSTGTQVATATADADGNAVIPIAADSTGYYVCFAESTDPANDTECSDLIPVGEDQVIVLSDAAIDDTSGELTYSLTTDDISNEIAAFQDPNNAHKTIMCHKNRVTISVGTPAALAGHLGHGDTPGPCPEDSNAIDTTTHGPPANGNNGNQGNNGNHGNNGNNGNNGNHGNPNTQTT